MSSDKLAKAAPAEPTAEPETAAAAAAGAKRPREAPAQDDTRHRDASLQTPLGCVTQEEGAADLELLRQLTGTSKPADKADSGADPEGPWNEHRDKRVSVAVSKIHGTAPPRKPRIGPLYQAVVPEWGGSPVPALRPSKSDKFHPHKSSPPSDESARVQPEPDA